MKFQGSKDNEPNGTDTIPELMKRHRVGTKKLSQSYNAFQYHTQNFFDNTVIVPSVHIGEASREVKKSMQKEDNSIASYFWSRAFVPQEAPASHNASTTVTPSNDQDSRNAQKGRQGTILLDRR
jgi:hypothetical protein